MPPEISIDNMAYITYNEHYAEQKGGDGLANDENTFDVEYYEKPDGTYPAEEFILAQNVKMMAKLFKLLDLLELKGNELREPYSKYLEDGILELRAIQGGDITRVLYFFVAGRRIILTHGFAKDTQKTPRAELRRAKDYRADYLEMEGQSDG
jgi:phage-related protein